eukprot:2249657-Pleurochrysis_carterae.AAC.1
MLDVNNRTAVGSSNIGVQLTENTYRRLMSSLCPTSLPTKNLDSGTAVRWSKRRNAERRRKEEPHPAARTETRRALSTTPHSETHQAEISNEAGDTEESTNDAEQESHAADGSGKDDDAESGSQAGHEASDADDAESHSHFSGAGDADGGGEEDDPPANSGSAKSGSPADHVGAPTPADESDDTPPAD